MQNAAHMGNRLRILLNRPMKVMLFCIITFTMYLFFNGALWKIWNLRRDKNSIEEKILNSKLQAQNLDMQIKQAKDPVFIERQAQDKLDLVRDNDLVFVFSE